MKLFGKLLAGVIGGSIAASLFQMVISLPFANYLPDDDSLFWGIGIAFWILLVLLSVRAQRPARAWRLQFILSGLLCFALPLSGIVFTGVSMIEVNDAPELFGTFLGGSLVTMTLGVAGFFAGLILLVIGLLIGREKILIRDGERVPDQERKTPTL